MTLRLSTLTCLALLAVSAQAQVTLTLDETVIAPKTRIGIGINGGDGWNNVVGVNLVNDSSFEGEQQPSGFARNGWPWNGDAGLTASVDTVEFVSGAQSQRIVVTAAGAMSQGRVTLPQGPLVLRNTADGVIRIKAQIKSDTPGARVRFGVIDSGWQSRVGGDITVGTTWQTMQEDYDPTTDRDFMGISVEFVDVATYWIDDLIAWNVDEMDPTTGLSATYVSRLEELRPASLRMGGLGVNGIPLESYLRSWWELDYGPPALQPDFDINTFLRLCRRVGAQPFITVPPAFSDATSWQVGDLTDHVIANVYVDHGNFVDYLGGDASTTYGARREADGHSRWDLEFDSIYLELGNELWGTPDGTWDMDPAENENQATQMHNYATYCDVRIDEMKARPGWRSNMKVGWAGRSPTMWLGGWDGSYDGTLIPAIGTESDFHTIDLYYGTGSASDSDEDIFGALYADALIHEREIGEMKTAYRVANGGNDIESTVYEGNATWGGYQNDLENPSPLYFKSVSQGAAVSMVDLYAAGNRAGLTVNNHFHYAGNIWGATGPYPDVIRKPAFHALKLFTNHIDGDLVTCTVTGSGTWNDTLTSEANVPYVACYPYKAGDVWSVLVINRHRSASQDITILRRMAPLWKISLTAADINANNETSEVVTLQRQDLSGVLVDDMTATIPAHSAVVLVVSDTGISPSDGATPSEDGASTGGDANVSGGDANVSGGDANVSGGDAASNRSADAPSSLGAELTGGCGCQGAAGMLWPLMVLALGIRWRRRSQSGFRLK